MLVRFHFKSGNLYLVNYLSVMNEEARRRSL